jgi:PTH1 family peptidyl-tRNA hydrolase
MEQNSSSGLGIKSSQIKVVVGLGNPGLRFVYTRHNIGFRILDALAKASDVRWRTAGKVEEAEIAPHDYPVTLIKPQTFMNSSGEIIPVLKKDGIKPENILVVHDELELPFGKLALKMGGGHRGHNGIRSLIQHAGPDFARLRVGIGRPEDKAEVPDYVLANFNQDAREVDLVIAQAVELILGLF